MRSRVVRLTCGAVAWIAIGAAAFFIIQYEKQIAAMRDAVRAFDVHAREATDALADLRASQQAYVAAGQGVAFWMPKVATTLDTATTAILLLREAAKSADARSALDEASRTVAQFGAIDQRARDYIGSEQQLMAADVVFTEGGETARTASRQVEAARIAEHQELDASEAAQRQQEAFAMAAAAVFAAVMILLLVPAGRLEATSTDSFASSGSGWLTEAARSAGAPASIGDDLLLHASGGPAPRVPSRPAGPVLKAAAQLCTDFGRVSDLDELRGLVARAADVMDATGLVVWLGDAAGGDLRPVIAHGYSNQVLARMPAVPRSADNAAAAAYRVGQLQIVLARPGSASGAVAAPLLSSEGCIGTLSAEIRGGGETSDSVQALATIFAAQLAGVIATTPEASEQRTASGSAGLA
jgi:hypothetical protein